MSGAPLFDEYYYKHGCGRPYERDEGWLNFFDGIAKRIIEEFKPKTVLDAGCALGFLVEAFRNHGVEAFGVDISEYAINKIHPSIKPYCWVGSITEPFPQKYDLITCIEVLEHLAQRDSEKAIANLCDHANEIIFSSTPFDHKEPTHFNVQPPEYWAEQFARYGFYRDMEADMSCITAWAVRFKKTKRTGIRRVREYERKFWQLRKENFDLQQSFSETQNRLTQPDKQIQKFTAQEMEKEQKVEALTAQVGEIERSKAWKVALVLRRIRVLLAPPNTSRARSVPRLKSIFFFPFRITSRNMKLKEDLALIRSSDRFNETWYLTNNPDITQARVDPALHYLRFGGFEGRDPGPNFCSAWYLDTYEDVKNEGVNPLLHYLKYGREEGRRTRPDQEILQPSDNINLKPEQADFDRWISINEPSPTDLIAQRTKANGFNYQPLISLVMPVWNTPTEILNQTISSVLQQTYGNWELCIADGASDSEIIKALSRWSEINSRIKIKYLDENKGIALNSNEALSLAQGEFIAFLDHDDLLAPYALFEIVSHLQIDKDKDVIYSDEDKIDEKERRFDAFFKPDFSPDYLRSVNYMPHFLVVRKSLGDQIGWLRAGYEGAQDYDLILRLVEKARGIVHIPKILYHWRVWTASTAGGVDSKPYANTSGKKALRGHLRRIGLSAQVKDGYSSTLYRAHYRFSNTPLVSIIIPNQDHSADLERCINSILQKTTYSKLEIILVENGSKEPETFTLYKQLEQNPKIHIIKWDSPYNNSRVNNWAVKHASGEVLLFLNSDTEIINKDWLEQMLQYAIRPDVGAVGAKLYEPDGMIQNGGIIIGIGGLAGYSHSHFPKNHPGYFFRLVLPSNVSAVTATCLMVRKQVFQEVDGFNENYTCALGDVDLCLNFLHKGYLNVWTPYAELYHFKSELFLTGSTIKGPINFKRESKYFKRKWVKFLHTGDPYYNPNLTLERENFDLNLPRY
jgi:glycosyltransferase involved in cell wall biosynthesis/SAM-dependent methyltransferase